MTQGLKPINCILLTDPTTGAPAGMLGADGREYILPALTLSGSGVTVPQLNNVQLGPSTASSVRTTNFSSALSDQSGTPGNVTNNNAHGRCAFAASGQTVTVTNSQTIANSSVFVTLGGSDATLTSVRVTTAAGSFTVTGNAAATGVVPFDYFIVNQ